ncbi:hypothetical protein Gorai_016585, partial [Gossypium raimondii]|nr:hypothetical protein [Gossypium raimondii]
EHSKPKGDLELIDLGCDYFLSKLENSEDYEYVIQRGLWFIGRHFFTTQKWTPNFRASEASFDFVAV